MTIPLIKEYAVPVGTTLNRNALPWQPDPARAEHIFRLILR